MGQRIGRNVFQFVVFHEHQHSPAVVVEVAVNITQHFAVLFQLGNHQLHDRSDLSLARPAGNQAGTGERNDDTDNDHR